MKKINLIFALLTLSISVFAKSSDSTVVKPSGYLSLGLSMTNSSDFLSSSYFGLEGGVTYYDFGFGLILGRGSLRGMATKQDDIKNYFYEAKISYSKPIGKITGTVFFGYGGYFATKYHFIEYGVGASYTHKKISYGLSVSNWDRVVYLTPSVTYNF